MTDMRNQQCAEIILTSEVGDRGLLTLGSSKEHLAIRRIFSLVDMITNTKFSNCPNVFEIGVV